MVSKSVLLISDGKNYEELLKNRNEDILNDECRDWNELVVCDFSSRNRVISREEQIKKIHQILSKWHRKTAIPKLIQRVSMKKTTVARLSAKMTTIA